MELFGLPAHPLIIHFPVVAIPTLGIIGLVMAISPSFRGRYGIAAIVLGIVTTVATFLAVTTGESLNDDLGFDDEFIGLHRQRGELLRFFVLGLTVAVGGSFATARASLQKSHPAVIATSVLLVAFAVLSGIWVVLTGHSGADAVWGF